MWDTDDLNGYESPLAPTHYIYGDNFRPSLWKGMNIDSMETSHLQNVQAMLQRQHVQTRDTDVQVALKEKFQEVVDELNKRKDEVITRNEFRITAEDIVALAKAKGVKIPKSGCGIYINSRENQKQIFEVFVRFDTTIKLKVKDK